MNGTGHTEERESKEASPRRSTVFILRGVSLGTAYGFWFLARWLYQASPTETPITKGLLVVTGACCVLFLLLGAVASDRLLYKIWSAIGKALVFLLMIS